MFLALALLLALAWLTGFGLIPSLQRQFTF